MGQNVVCRYSRLGYLVGVPVSRLGSRSEYKEERMGLREIMRMRREEYKYGLV